MKPRKRARKLVPVRVHKTSPTGSATEIVCTWDLSEGGVRLTGLRGSYEVNNIVRVERGPRQAKYRVIWVGEKGTPVANQIGLELCKGEKPVWQLEPADLEEQYDPLVRPEHLVFQKEISLSPGVVRAHIFGGNQSTDVQLIKFSLRQCTLLVPEDWEPKGEPIQLIIASKGFGLHLRGSIRRCDAGQLVLDLEEVRRGDRAVIEHLFSLSEVFA